LFQNSFLQLAKVTLPNSITFLLFINRLHQYYYLLSFFSPLSHLYAISMSNLQPSQNAMISSFRVESNTAKDSAAARSPQDAAANYANYSFHPQPYPHYAPMANHIKGESMEQPQDQIAFFQSYQQPIPPSSTTPDTDYRRQSWASSKKDEDGLYSPSSNDSSNDMYETETQRAQYVNVAKSG
jgi:hypothetical protein